MNTGRSQKMAKEQGNNMVAAIPDEDPLFTSILTGLGYFLKTGELMQIAENINAKNKPQSKCYKTGHIAKC